MTRIRVLVADDQAVFRTMMVETLAEEDDLEVVGQARDGVEAIELCKRLRPDIVLLDINMPRLNGVQATSEIIRACPGSRVVILTAFDEDQLVFQVIQAGATGYVLKDSHSDEVIRAIRVAHSNESLIQPRVANKILREYVRLEKERTQPNPDGQRALETLTDRELEVLRLVGRGLNNREICDSLFISEPTVKTHFTNVMQKMQFRDRVEAVLFAVQAGLV